MRPEILLEHRENIESVQREEAQLLIHCLKPVEIDQHREDAITQSMTFRPHPFVDDVANVDGAQLVVHSAAQ